MSVSEENLGGIVKRDAQKIIGLISVLVPEAKIILFGSRAKGTYAPQSDIDIALDAGEKIPLEVYGELITILKESSILQKIDLIDVHRIDESFKEDILQHGIVWKS